MLDFLMMAWRHLALLLGHWSLRISLVYKRTKLIWHLAHLAHFILVSVCGSLPYKLFILFKLYALAWRCREHGLVEHYFALSPMLLCYFVFSSYVTLLCYFTDALHFLSDFVYFLGTPAKFFWCLFVFVFLLFQNGDIFLFSSWPDGHFSLRFLHGMYLSVPLLTS